MPIALAEDRDHGTSPQRLPRRSPDRSTKSVESTMGTGPIGHEYKLLPPLNAAIKEDSTVHLSFSVDIEFPHKVFSRRVKQLSTIWIRKG